MDIVPLVDRIGEPQTAALFGLITGLIFGIAAQRSSFCLRLGGGICPWPAW